MLAYNVAASQIARPNLQVFLFKIKNGSTYIDWHQERMKYEDWTMQPEITRASVMGFFVAVVMHKEQ